MFSLVGDGGRKGKSSNSKIKSIQLVAVPPLSHACTCVPKPLTTASELKKALLCSEENKKCDHPARERERESF